MRPAVILNCSVEVIITSLPGKAFKNLKIEYVVSVIENVIGNSF
jgi:hypothetical protein